MVRRYHRYGRCLPRSLLQVALSLCSRSDSLLPSSRSLLPLITWDAGRHCFAAVCRASFSRSWGVHHIAMVPTLDFVFLSPPPPLRVGAGRGAFSLFLRPRWLVARWNSRVGQRSGCQFRTGPGEIAAHRCQTQDIVFSALGSSSNAQLSLHRALLSICALGESTSGYGL